MVDSAGGEQGEEDIKRMWRWVVVRKAHVVEGITSRNVPTTKTPTLPPTLFLCPIPPPHVPLLCP